MKSAIKVLQLIDSGGLYGAENVIINLSTAIRSKGYDNAIGCLTYSNKPKPEIGLKAESFGFETTFFNLRHKFDFTCVKGIGDYCKRNKIDIIHSHGYKPSLLCLLLKKLYGIPFLITVHLRYIENTWFRIYTLIEKICMRFSGAVVCVSEQLFESLHEAGVPDKKLRLIHNGIDASLYVGNSPQDELELRNELGLRGDSLIVGSLGRLTKQKDYNTFLRAAAEVLAESNAVEFVIAGDGELRQNLVSLAVSLGIKDRVQFLGFRDDKINILRLINIFVLSSIDEGLPIAMLEAMASGIPVVVTRVGGIPNVVTHGLNGMLIDMGDIKQLSETLLLLIRDPGRRKELGANAHKTVAQQFSSALMAQKYTDIYDELVLRV